MMNLERLEKTSSVEKSNIRFFWVVTMGALFYVESLSPGFLLKFG
jgi:hypothetical protein